MSEPSHPPAAPQDLGSEGLTLGVSAITGEIGKPRSLWSDAWHDLRRNPTFIVSALLILFLVVVAVVPSLFTGTDPKSCFLEHSNETSAPGHPFGFTRQGCDIYARVIYGARASVMVGVLVTSGVVLLGGVIGALAAFYGGALDAVLSRITDTFFAIPLLLGAIVFLQAFPFRNIWTVVAAIMILGWPTVARIMSCLLYTSDAADDLLCVDLGGRRIIKKKKNT